MAETGQGNDRRLNLQKRSRIWISRYSHSNTICQFWPWFNTCFRSAKFHSLFKETLSELVIVDSLIKCLFGLETSSLHYEIARYIKTQSYLAKVWNNDQHLKLGEFNCLALDFLAQPFWSSDPFRHKKKKSVFTLNQTAGHWVGFDTARFWDNWEF